MTYKIAVKIAYQAMYPNPIALEAGDLLTLTGQSDNWNGHIWLWAVAEKDGREGWVPDSVANATVQTQQKALFAYDARELSCHKAEVLTVVAATNGWLLCENKNGEKGWVPEENLEMTTQR